DHATNVMLGQYRDQALFQFFSFIVQVLIGPRSPKYSQCDYTGCHRHRISGERSCLINGTKRREQIHDLSATAKGSQWKPATQNFSEASQVRFHIKSPLCAAESDAESSNDLIKDQQRFMPPGNFA